MNWIAFLMVLIFSVGSAAAVVALYGLGIRLLTIGGRPPMGLPAEFTDAITVLDPEEVRAQKKARKKAVKKNPLTDAQKRLAITGAWACFALSGGVVLFGIYLIIPVFHK